ncbi:ribonuclease D [Aliiruegeria sabulilitoris]|uniref:ribonuclease D n=1 Tax=Aliiruegeria sabulilitoris TaxID=1510458 RepID=UPI000833EADD|nr:ribonuclease D [Aliiruegeria sabulilitoris]NDR54910.1 ribonuclease D [Pseudoruegeria sp. M32A2M]
MRILTTTDELATFCEQAKDGPYVTLDTEFLRERTYYSKLCLIQMALPGMDGEAVLIDPIQGGDALSMEPLYDLFRNTNVVKVFHAARQDLEIFFHEGNVFPEPLFDTQVAAMVCGFGEQVGYETLVRKIVRGSVDKSSRFTDWSRRPLSEAQQNYALADVTHLRGIYEFLAAQLEKNGRTHWLGEELSVLTDPATYCVVPQDAWKRVKTRTNSGKFLSIVRELARFREIYAQERNIPRNRVFKDDALLELASTKPSNVQELGKSRMLLRDARKGAISDGILAAIATGLATEPEDYPKPDTSRDKLQVNPALADLLRVLLKAKSESSSVAQKLIATSSDLDMIASGRRDVAALKGWREEVFGADALRLCEGKIALAADGANVRVIEL